MASVYSSRIADDIITAIRRELDSFKRYIQNSVKYQTITSDQLPTGEIGTRHVSSSFGETINLVGNPIYIEMDTLIGHRMEIVSTSDILSDAIQNTTLTARVWHGSQDVTDTIPASRFNWKRVSADSTADNIWNALHTGMKTITLTVLDVQYSATYSCELLSEEGI